MLFRNLVFEGFIFSLQMECQASPLTITRLMWEEKCKRKKKKRAKPLCLWIYKCIYSQWNLAFGDKSGQWQRIDCENEKCPLQPVKKTRPCSKLLFLSVSLTKRVTGVRQFWWRRSCWRKIKSAQEAFKDMSDLHKVSADHRGRIRLKCCSLDLTEHE